MFSFQCDEVPPPVPGGTCRSLPRRRASVIVSPELQVVKPALDVLAPDEVGVPASERSPRREQLLLADGVPEDVHGAAEFPRPVLGGHLPVRLGACHPFSAWR